MPQPRIGITPTTKIDDASALARVYTPGVAEDCRAVAADPAAARRLTVRGNSVAVVSDGSAVLGLGDIGPAAALPVLEGKAALYKRFAGIDAWPLCLDSRDVPDMVRCIRAVAPGFGGISLEDVAAPRCFDLERQLRDALAVPVFHDDQHGTAVVVLGALINALRVTGKSMEDPDPEIDPAVARRHAAVVATGRSDEPNQINNVLAFPGIFRGLLDSGARELSLAAQRSAARAIADTVAEGKLSPEHIVPDVFNTNLVPAVARAVESEEVPASG